MENVGDNNSPERESTMKISKSKRVFSLLIATTFALFGLLVLCPVDSFADPSSLTLTVSLSGFNFSNLYCMIFRMDSNTLIYSGVMNSNSFTTSVPYDISLRFRFYTVNRPDEYIYLDSSVNFVYGSVVSSPVNYVDSSYTLVFSSLGYVSGSSSYSRFNLTFSYRSLPLDTPTPTPTSTPTPTPTPAPTPTPDPAEWLNNYIFNQTSEDMWVGVEDINADDVTYDVIPAWSYKNFYFKRNTTYRITARTEQENVYYSLQYYTDLYNYVPLEYSLSSEGWYTYTELPYTSINISTGSDINTSGIYTFVRFRHDLPTLPPVTPVPGTTFTPDPSSSPTVVPYVTPIPGNPTLIPDNSTPTPIPDISGEAVAGFNKLTNIFNGIFDAAYQSVNAANGNFWTSFFFIGLPIFLVILGLIAWIIFGLSDDD